MEPETGVAISVTCVIVSTVLILARERIWSHRIDVSRKLTVYMAQTMVSLWEHHRARESYWRGRYDEHERPNHVDRKEGD